MTSHTRLPGRLPLPKMEYLPSKADFCSSSTADFTNTDKTQTGVRNLGMQQQTLLPVGWCFSRTLVTKTNFTITAEIHARSLANFYCQYADQVICDVIARTWGKKF